MSWGLMKTPGTWAYPKILRPEFGGTGYGDFRKCLCEFWLGGARGSTNQTLEFLMMCCGCRTELLIDRGKEYRGFAVLFHIVCIQRRGAGKVVHTGPGGPPDSAAWTSHFRLQILFSFSVKCRVKLAAFGLISIPSLWWWLQSTPPKPGTLNFFFLCFVSYWMQVHLAQRQCGQRSSNHFR